MNPPETNPELGKAILEVVENQIRNNDPRKTRQTVERLIRRGASAAVRVFARRAALI